MNKPPEGMSCTLTPNWMADCTLFQYGAFSIAFPRAFAAPGIEPPIAPPDPFPWPITGAMHLERELYVRIGSLPPIEGIALTDLPMAVIQSIANKRGASGVAVAKGDANEPSWGSQTAKRAAFQHRGTDGLRWVEDLLVIARADAGAIMIATLLPETEIAKLGTLIYIAKRTIHWDPQRFSPPTPIQIPPSIYFEPSALPQLSSAALQQKSARIAAMASERPATAAAVQQLLEPHARRPIVDWDAPVPPELWTQLQGLARMFESQMTRDLYANHLQYVRSGLDVQGLAMVWAMA